MTLFGGSNGGNGGNTGGNNKSGGQQPQRGNNARSQTYSSNASEAASSTASSIFSNTSHGAPSTMGGATSVTGGYETAGKNGNNKDRKGGYGGQTIGEEDATLDGIANEMINGNVTRGSRSGTVGTTETSYEDAREEATTPVGNNNSGRDLQQRATNTVDGGRGNNNRRDQSESTPAMIRESSQRGGAQNRAGGQAQQQQQQQQPGSRNGQQQDSRGGHQYNNQRSSGDQQPDRRGAGYANVSSFEQTDAASFIGMDPIAQAGDFAREDADIIFLSSEMGAGPNRQPMTRFRIHSVNLNVHSPVLSEMIDDLNEDQSDLQLEEDAATLKLLFGLMYNRPAPSLGMNEWQVVLRLARCAQKYDVSRAKEVAAAYFTEQEQLGALSPFMTYAFAVQYKLPALEESAAERSVRYDIHRLPELVFNMMGFTAFQQLAAFHTRRQSHYSDALNNIVMDPKELADQCYQTGGVCVIAPWSKLKQKLGWPRQVGKDGSKRPPEPADVIRKLVTEIGQIDCGTCSKALVEGALQAQLALESMPSYADKEDAF